MVEGKAKSRRFEYLYQLWAMAGGETNSAQNIWEIGEMLKLEQHETQKIVAYLMGENLIEYGEESGTIKITHKGADRVECSIKELEELKEQKKALEPKPPIEKKAPEPKKTDFNPNRKRSAAADGFSISDFEPYLVGIALCIIGASLIWSAISYFSPTVLIVGSLIGVIGLVCIISPESYMIAVERFIDLLIGKERAEEE